MTLTMKIGLFYPLTADFGRQKMRLRFIMLALLPKSAVIIKIRTEAPIMSKYPAVLLAVAILAAQLSAAAGGENGPTTRAGRALWECGGTTPLWMAAARGRPADAAQESTSAAADPATAGLSSLQKSLLVPGWGQAAEKHYVEAVLFFSAEVLCWAGFIDQNTRGNRSYDLYRSAAATEDAVRYRRETEAFDKRRNMFLLGAALVWAANLLDMSLIASRSRSGDGVRDGARSISLRLDCVETHQVALALAYRF